MYSVRLRYHRLDVDESHIICKLLLINDLIFVKDSHTKRPNVMLLSMYFFTSGHGDCLCVFLPGGGQAKGRRVENLKGRAGDLNLEAMFTRKYGSSDVLHVPRNDVQQNLRRLDSYN